MTKVDNVSEIGRRILDALPKDGSKSGNTSLMRSLGLQPDQYWDAVDQLEKRELVARGKGRGGSIGLLQVQDDGDRKAAPNKKSKLVDDEFDLYQPLKKWFDETWGPNYKAPDLYVSIITGPPKGHARKSGKWSRPDLSVVTVSSVEFFVPNKSLEVTTVEVKRSSQIDVVGVFEAASHSKFGHQSYVAFEWSKEEDMDKCHDEVVSSVLKEASRFGIGVIQIRRVEGGAWLIQEISEAERRTPDPQECSDYIERHFAEHHKQLRNAIK